MTKKGDGSHVKESTDSTNTTLEDDDNKGRYSNIFWNYFQLMIKMFNLEICLLSSKARNCQVN